MSKNPKPIAAIDQKSKNESPGEQDQVKEMDLLAERLTHSEASLAAMLAGEIDAILDPSTSTPVLLHHAQASLMESHRLLDLIYSNLNVSLAYMDQDFNFIRVNQAYAASNGMHPAEFTGKNHFQLFPSEEARAIFQQVADSGQAFETRAAPFSNPLRPEEGITYWDWTLQPLKSVTGEVQGLLLVLVDVTEQKKAELALTRRTSLLQLLHDIAVASNEVESVEAIMQFAVDRICTFTNWPVGHALLKDPVKGLISTHLWHLQPGIEWLPFKAVSEQVSWSTRGGLPRKVLSTAAPIWVEDLYATGDFIRADQAKAAGLKSMFAFPALIAAEPVGVVEFFSTQQAPVDQELFNILMPLGAQLGRVIERMRSRQAIQRSEALFRAIFEESALGIQVNDPQGNFLESNPALQRMLGYSADELRQLGLTEVTHPEDLDRVWLGIKKLLRGEQEQVHVITRYVCKDGSLVWAQQVSSLVRDANGPQYLIMLVDDITENRRMEIELSELQRRLFDSIETERQRLAADLHDGPLQDLYGASFQLLDVLPDLQDSEQGADVANAQAIVQHVISSLRVICGELRPPTLAPFGLEKAIRAHADRLQKVYPMIQFHMELASDGPLLTEQGRMALFRAYQQLISNAARHAQARNVWIRFRLDPREVVLEVEDDGRGFNLPDRWIDLAREGRMGLVGISERAEDFGGRLEVVARPKGGSTMRVVLPRERVNRKT